MSADRWPPRSGAARIAGFVLMLAWAAGSAPLLGGCADTGGADHAGAAGASASASTSTVPGAPPPGSAANAQAWRRNGAGHGYYRWLGRTTGDPPTVAQENRSPGTASWRLPGPHELIGGEARGTVEGYVSSQSPIVGQRESVYVSAPGARTVRIGIYRMGWYGGLGGRLMLETSALPVTHQPRCAHSSRTGLTQCDWRPTLSLAIPSALPSGVYIVKLTASDGAERDCIFVLRSARAAPLLVELPTASWEAYNEWGGDSLYPGGEPVRATRSTQGGEVSYDRPYDSQTGAGQFFIREVAMVRFLERHGYPVSYTTIDALDRDPAQALEARAVIDVGHSEYWSQRAAGALAHARAHGVSLIFISSDTMAWRVRFRPAGAASSEHGMPDHVIVAYKQSAAADPDRRQPSGLFPGGGGALAGSAYDGCITPRLPVSGPPSYRYYAWRPAPGLAPAWLFAHSGVSAGTSIPGIVGYELDERATGAPAGTRVVGEGAAPCLPEHEPSAVYGAGAQTTLYSTRSGGLVFATGTLGWEYGLEAVPQASPDVPRKPDPRVVAITRNLLAHVLAIHHRRG
jgi:hypothetical protein